MLKGNRAPGQSLCQVCYPVWHRFVISAGRSAHPASIPGEYLSEGESGLVVLIGVAPAQHPATLQQRLDPVLIRVVDIQQVHELIFDMAAEGLFLDVPLHIPNPPDALHRQLNVQAMEGDERQLHFVEQLGPFGRNLRGLVGPDVLDQSDFVHGWAFYRVSDGGSLS